MHAEPMPASHARARSRPDVRAERAGLLPAPVPVQLRPGPRWVSAYYHAGVRQTGATAAQAAAGGRAVLLCNPFGQEAIRCHRTFRLISERLARAGIATLRFDYFGTGDSGGGDGEGRLDIWRRDVILAHEALMERSGAEKVAWIGLRLGGSVALEALRTTPRPPARVVLWDPVIDGQAYLDELSRHHAFWTRQTGVTSEALGFLLTPELRQDIAAIDLRHQLGERWRAELAMIIGRDVPGKDDMLNQLANQAKPIPCVVTQQTTIWCSNEALGSQWVPSESVDAVMRLTQEPA